MWKQLLIVANDVPPADPFASLATDRFLIGVPERCVAQLRRFVQVLGTNDLIFRLYFPGMPHAHILRELDLLSRHVLPALR